MYSYRIQFNGTTNGRAVLVAISGKVFDVTVSHTKQKFTKFYSQAQKLFLTPSLGDARMAYTLAYNLLSCPVSQFKY